MTNEELQNEISDLQDKVEKLEKESFKFPLQKPQKDALALALESEIVMGAGSYLDMSSLSFTSRDKDINEANEVNTSYMVVGRDRERSEGNSSGGNTQIMTQHNEGTTGTSNQSFHFAFRPPLYINKGISITSGNSTLSDSFYNWDTNELAGSYVTVQNSSGDTVDSFKIVSNTSTVITVDGTWSSTESGATYVVFMPVYLGSAGFPWRRGYFGEDIRLGFGASLVDGGASSGSQVQYIKWGEGTPESVIVANVGSIYLRRDGGSGTTLYVKESGTGTTGWSAV